MIKKISLFLVAIFSMIALAGCFSIDDIKTLEFVNLPQSTYYKVEEADVDKVNKAYDELLGEITIRIDAETVSLKDAIANKGVTINFDASILTSVGTKTMVITLGNAKLTYVFKVVEEQLFAAGKGTEAEPYLIETPQQFINIGTRLFGIPVPTNEASEDAWMYYYQFSFPYIAGGKHYKIMNDLDFTGIDYRTLGSLGGMNYIPFTGVLNGQNYKIKNLTVNTFSDSSSLFAALSGATVKNLTFTNINIDSKGKYGAALFSQPGRNGENYINIVDNVNVESGLIVAERFGGLGGEALNTFFKDCTIGLKENPNSLLLKQLNQSNSGGIIGAALTSRAYSYKNLNYTGGNTHVNLFDFNTIKELSQLNVDTINYINAPYRQKEANKSVLSESSTQKFNVVIFNCNVYTTLYFDGTVGGNKRGGVYTDGSSESVFIFNSNNETENIVKNNDSEIIKDVTKSEQMSIDDYASVEYTFQGTFEGGTYSYQVLRLTANVFEMEEFNLDSLGFKNYLYNIDGEIVETLSPKIKQGSTLVLSAFYYDDQGKIIGIYRESIESTGYNLDTTRRVLTLKK